VMQKYTRSSRSTTRGSSIESTEESAPDSHHLPLSSSASTTNATRQTVVAIPEPIRRWHSFHSRRSSFGHSAAPHLPVVVTGASAAPASASSTPPITKPAARFLSPPPLTPRRRFSVWYTQTNNRTKQNKAKRKKILYVFLPFLIHRVVFQSTGSIVLVLPALFTYSLYNSRLMAIC
jgi:hypothetical protein